MRPDDRLRSPLTIALEPVTVDPGTLYDSILTNSADQIHSRIHNILVDKPLPPVGIFAPGGGFVIRDLDLLCEKIDGEIGNFLR